MPKNKHSLKRICVVAISIQSTPGLTRRGLLEKVNRQIDEPITSHTIEKDLQILKFDFDAPLVYKKGYRYTEEYSFKTAFLQYFLPFAE